LIWLTNPLFRYLNFGFHQNERALQQRPQKAKLRPAGREEETVNTMDRKVEIGGEREESGVD
jgi:hypothetical protein